MVALRLSAVDQVLLRKRNKFSGLLKVSSFHGSDGWESPARSAVALVFNRVDVTLCSPVDISRVSVAFSLKNWMEIVVPWSKLNLSPSELNTLKKFLFWPRSAKKMVNFKLNNGVHKVEKALQNFPHSDWLVKIMTSWERRRRHENFGDVEI